ncbi:hypothetical protein [Nocardia noduli]|uniref:hypothetical protein n=1 Tax=Nocardia noduli TaxID=2815722 RepID=UPI001C21D3FB|nr:hypothetical protein [Nocardia noduli]
MSADFDDHAPAGFVHHEDGSWSIVNECGWQESIDPAVLHLLAPPGLAEIGGRVVDIGAITVRDIEIETSADNFPRA